MPSTAVTIQEFSALLGKQQNDSDLLGILGQLTRLEAPSKVRVLKANPQDPGNGGGNGGGNDGGGGGSIDARWVGWG